jgi:hypothetical protein
MTGHLTSQQVTAWRSGVASPEEILRLDDHLAECPECRALVASQSDNDAGLALRTLQAEFSAPHLTEAQLDDYAAHRPVSADVIQHLDRCPECRADADNLRQFATRPNTVPSRPPIYMAAAAAIAVTAVGVAAWLATTQRQATPTNPTPVAVAANIPSQYQAEVQAAIDSETLHIPAAISGMSTGPIQLRSDAQLKPSAFRLISPQATAVIEDRPTFRWTPIEGTTYIVSVYDDQFRPVATSPSLQTAEWHPEKPFARGATYLWEVQAAKGAHTYRAPAPTEPEARFVVLNAVDANRLTQARAAMPQDPLAVGILEADVGALEDARRDLTAAGARNLLAHIQ